MKILVTGAEGFVGPHLIGALKTAGHTVEPTSWRGSVGRSLDLTDAAAIDRVIEEVAPDAVIHLAAISSVPEAAQSIDRAWQVNVDGTRRLAAAHGRVRPDGVFLAISTGALYASSLRAANDRLDESHLCRPETAYGSTKVAMEAALEALRRSDDPAPRIVIARPFNHIGPGQEPNFALPGFAEQIVRGEAAVDAGEGVEPLPIHVGNLDVKRDFLDVRDVVEAYRTLIEDPTAHGVFNVCSGESRSLRSVLDRLRSRAVIATEVVPDPSRIRSTDPDAVEASSARLRRETGWAPKITLDTTLDDILDDWRARIRTAVEIE